VNGSITARVSAAGTLTWSASADQKVPWWSAVTKTKTGKCVDRLDAFKRYYNQIARPFDWRFTRADLADLLQRLVAHEPQLSQAA